MSCTINISGLKKGDYIAPEIIEEITGEIVGTSAYQLAALNLKTEIEHDLQQQAETEAEIRGTKWTGGCPITLKHEEFGIRLLTDAEAAVYNAAQGEHARHKLFRAFRRNQNVDETNLSDNGRQAHYRTLEVQGKYVQSLRKIRREMFAEPSRRQTPGIPI